MPRCIRSPKPRAVSAGGRQGLGGKVEGGEALSTRCLLRSRAIRFCRCWTPTANSSRREQRQYLTGYFAGIEARGLPLHGRRSRRRSAEAKPPWTISIFEERVKRELHPLDAYPQLLENAAFNKAPDKEDLFRFKWHGLFFLTPAREAFMARLRIPGGLLKTFQLRELAAVARELTTGYVQITTRANLQMRLIQPKDAPEVLRRIQSVGLHTRGAGADNIRNLTANPTAGIDPRRADRCHAVLPGAGADHPQ